MLPAPPASSKPGRDSAQEGFALEPDFESLVELVGRLRADDGCPWDRRQTLVELRAYLLEEAHELAAAIDAAQPDEIEEELGDLLFQAAFIARLGEEQGTFTARDAVAGIRAKMIERHPHVFGESQASTAEDVQQAWERAKAARREQGSHLDGVPASLPALVAAYRLGQKAAGVGFDWDDIGGVVDKVREELAEVLAVQGEHARAQEEIGDLLFAVASLARHLGIDPEAALAQANLKFRRRFAALEASLLATGSRLGTADSDRLEAAWRTVKEAEVDS